MLSEQMIRNNRFYFIIYIIFFFILFNSCSIEKNRKVLSIFFDGVPEKKTEKKTDAVLAENSVNRIRIVPKTSKTVSQHPDHKSRNCSKCHSRSSANFLVTDKKKLCFTCHKKEKFDGAFIHGPVAVQACSACHSPHKSNNRKLLLAKGKELCLLCHKIPLMGSAFPCKGDICIECHEPHVATNKYFLKEDIKRTDDGKKAPAHSNI